MNVRSKVSLLLSLSLLVLCRTPAAFGQATTGSISGTVTDPGGANVADVRIKARNVSTGQELDTTTTGAGVYVLPSVPVGIYELTAEQQGFKKVTQQSIEVRVAIRSTVDFQLEVGTLQQSVDVQ